MIRSAAELAQALNQKESCGRAFSFEATVSLPFTPETWSFPVCDRSGAVFLRNFFSAKQPVRGEAGDVFLFSGIIGSDIHSRTPFPSCRTVERRGHVTPPTPTALRPGLLGNRNFDFRPLFVRGKIRDVLPDEIDSECLFLIIWCNDAPLTVPIPSHSALARRAPSLVGADVELLGFSNPLEVGSRRMLGNCVYLADTSAFRVTAPARDGGFDVPDISEIANLSPGEVARKDHHGTWGRVEAVLHDNIVVLRTPEDRLVRVSLSNGHSPRCGQVVDAVGFPESDLYRINLVRARWRTSERTATFRDAAVTNVSARFLFQRDRGLTQFNASAYGATVRLRGIVRTLADRTDNDVIVNLESDGTIIPVDTTSAPTVRDTLGVGDTVEVTGLCVMESESWRPNHIFPAIQRAIIVPRGPEDIRIVAHPPWWTPGRLLSVIGILLAVIVGILAWNASLRVLAQRRGRELFKSQIAKVASELRVSERTRLAVELHDSITQNLTGVTLQLDAATSAREDDPAAADAILSVARRTLQSCLVELRRCLWDLRSEALEMPDFNQAIRVAVRQVSARADIAVRFNINRSRLSDATAHAILRIIRELVANAVRHGKATKIRIAGEMLPNRIHFAVTDNGTGFDPDAVKGPGDGHFGLSGIRERLKDLCGTIAFTSSQGKGTRAEISIELPQSTQRT